MQIQDVVGFLHQSRAKDALEVRTAILRELALLLARLADDVHQISVAPVQADYFVQLVEAQQNAFDQVVRWTAFAVQETRDELEVVQGSENAALPGVNFLTG